jgi:hypothetical protein
VSFFNGLDIATAQLKGPRFSRQHTGYRGAGYADYVNDTGDYVEWTKDLADTEGGDYLLSFWYANGGKTDRPLELKVTAADGRTATRTVHFVPTGTWTDWNVATVSIPFFAGTNRIRLTSIGANGPNLSSFWTNSFSVPPPSPRTFADFNDQAAEATTAPVGGIKFLQIDNPTDVDVLRLDVAAGQKLGFDVDLGGGNLDPYIRLFDSSGRQIAANDNGPGPGEVVGRESYLEYRFPTAGAYYVAFSDKANTTYDLLTGGGDRAGGTGDYRVLILDKGGAFPAPAGADNDDQLSEAIPGVFDSRVDGEISLPTDVDLYRITLEPDLGEPFVQVDNRFDNSATLLVRLFDTAGREVARQTSMPERSIFFDITSDNDLQALTARFGDYYVGISVVPNGQYNPLTGGGDAAGPKFGGYTIEFGTFDSLPPS